MIAPARTQSPPGGRCPAAGSGAEGADAVRREPIRPLPSRHERAFPRSRRTRGHTRAVLSRARVHGHPRRTSRQNQPVPHSDRLIYGSQVWPELTRAASRPVKRHIVSAYVGQQAAELMPLGKGDVAVIDGSATALKAGQSSPDAIAAWLQAGAHVYSFEGLHAKAYLLGGCVFVGSANASRHSQEQLLEAVLHTDRRDLRDQVLGMVLDLAELAAEPLDTELGGVRQDAVPTAALAGCSGATYWRADFASRPVPAAVLDLDDRDCRRDRPVRRQHCGRAVGAGRGDLQVGAQAGSQSPGR